MADPTRARLLTSNNNRLPSPNRPPACAKPRSRFGRTLHELHMRHHFEDEERGFGVSAPWLDIVFGTASRRSRSSRSTTP